MASIARTRSIGGPAGLAQLARRPSPAAAARTVGATGLGGGARNPNDTRIPSDCAVASADSKPPGELSMPSVSTTMPARSRTSLASAVSTPSAAATPLPMFVPPEASMPANDAALGSASGESTVADVSKSMTALRSGRASGPAAAAVVRLALNCWPATTRRKPGSVSVLEPDESMTIARSRPWQSLTGSSCVTAQTMSPPRRGP